MRWAGACLEGRPELALKKGVEFQGGDLPKETNEHANKARHDPKLRKISADIVRRVGYLLEDRG